MIKLLQTTNLTKTFGGLIAVSDVDIHVSEGEIVGLVGPNSAGISTLLNLISGIYRPVMVATVGNYLWACTSYYLGLAGRTQLVGKYFHIDAARMEHAQIWFKKYGSWSLLFTWVPVFGDALPVVAGMLRTNKLC